MKQPLFKLSEVFTLGAEHVVPGAQHQIFGQCVEFYREIR